MRLIDDGGEARESSAEGAGEALAKLTSPGVLRARLQVVSTASSVHQALVGLSYRGERSTAAVGTGAIGLAENARLPVGCFAKLLTGALVDLDLAAGTVGLDQEVSGLMGRAAASLGGIRVRHLLEHTHGIDDTAWSFPIITPDGMLDLEALFGCVRSSPRLTAPGTAYSYSHAGAWILCALLERLHGVCFRRLVMQRLGQQNGLSCLADPEVFAGESEPCASTGGSLGLPLDGMLAILERAARTCSPVCFGGRSGSMLETESFPLPGWSPTERGIRLGWKFYGAGWFGHTSEWWSMPALVRINPESGIAIVVACDRMSPITLAGAIFADVLPDLFAVNAPAFLSGAERLSLDVGRLVGEFRNSAVRLQIRRAGNHGLKVIGFRRATAESEERPEFDGALFPARHSLFFVRSAQPAAFQFLQFLPLDKDRPDYVWDGRTLIPACRA